MKKVDEVLLCKHKQKICCYEKSDLSSVKCNSLCKKLLPCGHDCKNKCGEKCTETCKVIIKLKDKLPCGHIPTVQCYKRNDPFECNEVYYYCDYYYQPCRRLLSCGHRCRGTCSKCKNGHIDCEVCLEDVNKKVERTNISNKNTNNLQSGSIRGNIYYDIFKKFT